MASAGGLAGPHRQHWLTAIQGLNLGLLIHAKNDGVLRWRDIKADDVTHLGHEVRVGRELESLHAVRLQPKGPPDALYA